MKRSGVICTRIRVHGRRRRRVLINSLNSRCGIEYICANREMEDKDLIFFSEHVFISPVACRQRPLLSRATRRRYWKMQVHSNAIKRRIFYYIMHIQACDHNMHARSDFLSFPLGLKQEKSSFVLCIVGIIYLFLSEWEEIPFLAPAHKFQSKLRKNKRERLLPGYFIHPLVSITHGCLGDMKFSRIILLVARHVACICEILLRVRFPCMPKEYIRI